MSYEIPQQLQHKERIVFGLTFTQLGWAAFFGFFVLAALASNLSLYVKMGVAVVPIVLGVLFIFFNMWSWVRNAIGYIRHREVLLGTKHMSQAFPIKEVVNDTIIAEDSVAVLRVATINFGIKTDAEKEGIIAGFQKFLNSLDFPVQILVNTQTLNLDKYLASLEERTKDKQRFEEFSMYINAKTATQRNREFFVIIPKRADLSIQSKLCQDRLESMGLQVERLGQNALLEFLAQSYNTKPSEHPSSVKGVHSLVAPGRIKDHADYLDVDGKLVRVVVATGYPRNVESGFLDKIISSNEDYDISIHVEPFSIETTMLILNQELQKQRADLYSEEQRKSINPSLEIKYRDTLKVLEALQKGEEKLFNVSLLIACKANTKEELNLLTRKVEAELHSIMIIPKAPLFRQLAAYKSMMPFGKNYLGERRNVTTGALSAFFPFTSPFLTMELSGTLLGLNKNNVPYIKDIFNLNNANGIVLATSGAGKSYFTKLLVSRQILNGTSVTVIDPQGEYTGLVQACNGEQISISRTSKTMINPLDLMGHDYIEKRLALMDLFRIMFGELSEVQKSILDKAVNETYARKGITADRGKKNKPPILKDLYKTLVEMDRKAAQSEKITYRALINRLYMYTDGVYNFLNRQTNINYENNFVCFNIGDMPKQVKPIVMFLILDYAYMNMKTRPGKKMLVVDEAWSLLSHTEEAGYLFEIVKTCRKFNMGLLLITQDVADLVNSNAGHAVLANSSYTFLLRQKPAIIDSVVRTFHLSTPEKNYLLTATQGKGILILDNDHQELSVIASEKEHELITTNPNEKTKTITKPDEKKEVDITVNTEKGLIYGTGMSFADKNYLVHNGYVKGMFVPIGKPRQEECWVKTNKVETIAHTFLVQNIKEHIKQHTQEVEVNIVSDADVVFKDTRGRNIAIEVETGSQYKKNRRNIQQKFADLDEQYDEVHIVLTDAEFKRAYERTLERPILVRNEVPGLLSNLFSHRSPARIRGGARPVHAVKE